MNEQCQIFKHIDIEILNASMARSPLRHGTLKYASDTNPSLSYFTKIVIRRVPHRVNKIFR
jgi:hypothetical protein